MKQITLNIGMIAVMLLSFLQASAYNNFVVDNIYYDILSSTDKTVSVTYRTTSYNSYSGKVKIPSSVEYNNETYSVTTIGYKAFYNCYELTSVEIPNSVTSIGESAFYDCSKLTSVEIPNSVTSIREFAFYNCYSLTSVEVPNSVTTISKSAFHHCSGLTSVEIPNSVTSIGDEAFYRCSSLTSVEIPNSVTSIGEAAFQGCSKLTSVEIPNSVTTISKFAFYGCSGLTSVEIPNSVTTISKFAFYGCSGLTSVEVPNSVTTIGSYAFYSCTGLRSLTIGANVTSIGEYSFEYKEYSNSSTYSALPNLKKIIVLSNTDPSGLYEAFSKYSDIQLYVANDNFSGYSSLGTIRVYDFLSSMFEVDGVKYVPISPAERTCAAIDCSYSTKAQNITIGKTVNYKGIEMTVKELNPYTLYANKSIKSLDISCDADIQKRFAKNCSSLVDIKLNNTGSIGQAAFYGASALKDVIIGNAVTNIGRWCFEGCSKLESAELGENISEFGERIFYGCTSLSAVNVPKAITSIPEYSFYNCTSLSKIELPENIESIGMKAFTNSGLTGIQLPSNLESIGYQSFYNTKLSEITIPSATTSVDSYAFSSCSNLEKVNILDSDTSLSLASDAFTSSPLKEVYIGRDINKYLFKNNLTLEKVTIGNIPEEVTANEFFGCTALKEVSIGDGVSNIGKYAFSGCSALETFTFGCNVASIGAEAFSDCTAMTKLYAEADTPPTCGTQALDDINKWECTLYVNESAKSKYTQADQWKEFFFVESLISGVEDVAVDGSDTVFTVYNLSGTLVAKTTDRSTIENLPKGIYIINGKKYLIP